MSIFRIEHAPVNPTMEYADSIKVPKGTTRIVAQGGGSTIDTAKWVAFKHKLPLTAIPTTAGTGSEATKYCVLMVDGKKKTFDLKEPDSYILDPSLVVSLPKLHTIASGIDALSQACESYWSKEATPESKLYAKVAMKLILKNLGETIKNPKNERARMNMLLGAHFSGKAINIAPTNICHAISYPLTEIYNIPHGIACGYSLAYFAKKALKLDLKPILKVLPKYEFDAEKIADIAIKHSKIKGYPHAITKQMILDSLV